MRRQIQSPVERGFVLVIGSLQTAPDLANATLDGVLQGVELRRDTACELLLQEEISRSGYRRVAVLVLGTNALPDFAKAFNSARVGKTMRPASPGAKAKVILSVFT